MQKCQLLLSNKRNPPSYGRRLGVMIGVVSPWPRHGKQQISAPLITILVWEFGVLCVRPMARGKLMMLMVFICALD